MTVSYTSKVTHAKQFGCFLKLLMLWRGSIYKLIWPDLFLFHGAFIFLGILYNYVLPEGGRVIFEKISIYCEKYGTLIPVAFVLGFYVSQVISRWWDQYKQVKYMNSLCQIPLAAMSRISVGLGILIPWIDTLSIWVHASIRGSGEKDRILRRTIVRYACLAITQCFTRICPRVKKRFPTLDHFVEAGLLLESEKEIMQQLEKTSENGAKYPTHFIALVWATGLIVRGRAENKVTNDAMVNMMITEINKIKDGLFMLISYDWISLPLVYTQVVTLAVYTYFLACLMGKQWLRNTNPPNNPQPTNSTLLEEEWEGFGLETIVVFCPVFTVLQFFFYMGWLKVAESLLNPFGDDDDDFELNWIVDRNIQVAYLIVDEMYANTPELLRDQYWNEIVPPSLPHTVASEIYKDGPPESSTANLVVPPGGEDIVPATSYKSSLQHLNGSPVGIRRRSVISRQDTIGGIGGSEGESKLERMGSAFKRFISKESRQSGQDDSELGSLVDVTTVTPTPGQEPGSRSVKDTIEELDETNCEKEEKDVIPDGDCDGELDPLRDVKTVCLESELMK